MDGIIQGLSPIYNKDARILILGSMPGSESLRQRNYYAHPTNDFWRIMGRLFGFDPTLSFEERYEILKQKQIALWDVVHSCSRHASSDHTITQVKPNHLDSIFADCPRLHHVFCNGQKSFTLYSKYFKYASLPVIRLPSTSRAYMIMNYAQKLEAWSIILKAHKARPK